MTIREATIADLRGMEQCAQRFYATSEFLKNFDIDEFVAIMTELFTAGAGVIFALFDDAGVVRGAIGGMASTDPFGGGRYGCELFWFVEEGFRGKGLRLYREFEAWARARNCKSIQMVHLTDSMPEKLARFYMRLGFKAAEVRYVKELAA